jgi:hypothetical protein
VSFFATPIEAQVEPALDLPEPFKQAVALATKNECAAAWDTMWRIAKKGDYDATFFLVEMSTFGGIRPPGSVEHFPASISYTRRMLGLAIYATLSRRNFGEPFNQIREALPQTIASLIEQYLNLGASGKQLIACFRSHESRASCVDLAYRLKLIPRFSSLVREFEVAARGGNKAAFCSPSILDKTVPEKR